MDLLRVHWLRLHHEYKIILYNFYLLIPLGFSSKLEDMKLTTSGIILWAALAILIEIMLGKNEDNSTQCNITHTRNSVQQGYVYTVDTLRSIKGKVDHDRRFKILNPQTCNIIRKLRLNCKKTRRGKKVKAQNTHQKRSVELENLITIQCKRESKIKRQDTNLHIM